MQAFILVVVLGSVAMTSVGCKSLVKEETASQTEFFRMRAVKKFLEAAKSSPSTDTSQALRKRFESNELLSTAAEKLDYETFKEVFGGLEKHALYTGWDVSTKAIVAAVGNIDADKKIAYLMKKGGYIDKALESLDLSAFPDLIRVGANPNKAMILAIERDNASMVRRIVEEFGADNLDEGLALSVRKNDIDVARYMIDKGATDLNKALLDVNAILIEDVDPTTPKMLELLLKHGAISASSIKEVLQDLSKKIEHFTFWQRVEPKKKNNIKGKVLILEEMQQIMRNALPAN